MGMLIEGDNIIRDLWSNLIDAAELGTGTTQETAQDTDLEAPISNSETTCIASASKNQFLKKVASFPGSNAGNEAITEMIWKKQSPELASSRITIPSVTWAQTQVTRIATRWYIRGKQG